MLKDRVDQGKGGNVHRWFDPMKPNYKPVPICTVTGISCFIFGI